ncbi:hypothetical protein CIPAW_09G016300 [Carya illinoinensis]|uniref:Uncharacterized protein n=1 Tax=Carya illinoinensis TaxID=32201 RepID=A0A8T1PG12_CARIL|nr:hypothetical protein CIPAW_09G016300 [Carya illinoinensis]
MVSNERTEKDSTNWRKPISVIKWWFSPSMRPWTRRTGGNRFQ